MEKLPFPIFIFSLAIAAAMLIPLVYLILRTADIGPDAFNLLLSQRTYKVLVNSVLLAAVVTVTATIIAVPLAVLTVRTDLPMKRLWSVVMVLPLVIPSYVGSYSIIAALGPRGSILQKLLEPYGIESLPSIYGWIGAVLALTLFSYPYILLTVRSSLLLLDPSIEEASKTLGCTARESFRRVTLPHIKPSIAAGALLVAFYTLSDFGTPSLMRFDSFTRVIYIQYQSSFDRSMAAVLALTLVGVAFLILFMEFLARGRARYYATGSGAKRPQKLLKLGRWRWPAVGLCAIVAGMALLLPTGVVFFWLLKGLTAGEAYSITWPLAMNSITVSLAAALVSVAAAIPIVILAVRFPGWLSTLLERITYTGFALPGIVVALSLVFFGVRYATFLYQSLAMLVFAYMVLFMPQAVGTLRSSLLQINPRMEEAAKSLGSTQIGALRSITIPLARPGLLTGAALVFLTTMKELPATLLLAPTGFGTLATRVWSATDDAFFARAALPSLILIMVSTISMFIILSQEKNKEEWIKQ